MSETRRKARDEASPLHVYTLPYRADPLRKQRLTDLSLNRSGQDDTDCFTNFTAGSAVMFDFTAEYVRTFHTEIQRKTVLARVMATLAEIEIANRKIPYN